MPITIIYGKNKLSLFSDLDNSSIKRLSLNELKNECSLQFGIPKDNILLIHAGAKMRDDQCTLGSYGVTERSKIVLMTTGTSKPPALKPTLPDNFENRQLEKIEAILSNFYVEFKVCQSNFESMLDIFNSLDKPSDNDYKKLDIQFLSAHEMGLKKLLDLDEVNVSDEFGINKLIRDKRKQAVNLIQNELEKLESVYKAALQEKNKGTM